MKKHTPLVSIIILNWNKPNDTVQCLRSVRNQSYKNVEIIVVDNGSTDNSLSVLSTESGIHLIKNPVNRGFTGGHIDGYKASKGEYIFVLNNDAIVDRDYLTNAMRTLIDREEVAVIGGRSYQWENEAQQYDSSGSYFAFQKINNISLEGIFERHDMGVAHKTNWVSGSAMVIRRSAIEKVGYFYYPFFAYYEESDLFARIQAAGLSIVYDPSLRIWHKDAASSSTDFQFYQLFKNRFIYGLRNLPGAIKLRFLGVNIKNYAKGAYRYLRHGVDSEHTTLNRAYFRALLHFFATWPRWILVSLFVPKRDPDGFTLRDRLRIEASKISFVIDLTKPGSKLSDYVNFIKETFYEHYESEFILVCDTDKENELAEYITTQGIKGGHVRIAPSRISTLKAPAINVGWLSAKNDLIWFVEKNKLPSAKLVKSKSLLVYNEKFSICANGPDLQGGLLVSRSILSIYGGMDNKNLKTSANNLFYFSSFFRPAHIYMDGFEKVNRYKKSPLEPKIKALIHEYNAQVRKNNFYSKLLKRYYRLYQLNNTSQWLFLPGISPRLKLARIRNLFKAVVRLRRTELAVELKHISNEVIKARYSGYDLEQRERELNEKISAACSKDGWKNTPIFIICRDRITPLKTLLGWFEKMGMKNIVLIDNDSIYPPLVKYLGRTKYQVIKTGRNAGHTIVWLNSFAKTLFPGEFYIVTDPDVIPDKDTPKSVIKYFYELHAKYIEYQKIGFGLRIDDLPEHYKLKHSVIEWEKQFWMHPLEQGVYEAGIDTTFALYKPYTDYYTLHPSIRTGAPYVAQHLPWYIDSSVIDQEESFYRDHANQEITSWNVDDVLERYKKELRRT